MKTDSHIGRKSWNRLSPGQKRVAIKDRKNAKILAKNFKEQRESKLEEGLEGAEGNPQDYGDSN